jgi:hypothetical protein
MLWVYLTWAKTSVSSHPEILRKELSPGKILEENLLQSALHKTLGKEFIF